MTDVPTGTERAAPPSLLVITGSPGSGKSALLSRIAVLADPKHRPNEESLAELAKGTVPSRGSLDGVVWCHNKTERQVVEDIARAVGIRASTAEALLEHAAGRSATIAIDALDEVQDGRAREVASRVLKPLAKLPGMRLLVATRRRPVRDGAGGEADLLDHLGVDPASVIDLDRAANTRNDIRGYVEARIQAAAAGAVRVADTAGNDVVDAPRSNASLGAGKGSVAELAAGIADAAGNSFLVAAIAARAAAAGGLVREDGSYALPTEVGEALARYIDALPDPKKARGLLRPLAWAQGAGMPWGTLWPRLAAALAKVAGDGATAYDDRDVRALLDHAGDLIVEVTDGGQPVYRLFHEALAEYFRAGTDETRSHDALASAMLELAGGRSWTQVPRYVTANLPVHLLGAGRLDELVELLTDPTWDRRRREDSGDPLAAVGIAEEAIERLLAESPADLRAVPLCVVHSRAMSTAAPLILDVIARSGQLSRAEMMANNLAYAPDRMLAYRWLCSVYAREGDKGAAQRCYEEVRRSLTAMPEAHQPMAWCWAAEAAHDAGIAAGVRASAEAAMTAALAIEGDGWDLPNGYFWAARASALAGWKEGAQRIRDELDALEAAGRGLLWRNQPLQAASVARHVPFLKRRLGEWLAAPRDSLGHIRDGNIALALADAGMKVEAEHVFSLVGDRTPQGNEDSNKRWAWALALGDRMDDALRALAHVHDWIERSKAVARIADVAVVRGKKETLAALLPVARELFNGVGEPRARARLIRVLWQAGEQAEALTLAEREIATGHTASAMADPRDGVGPGNLDGFDETADPSSGVGAKKVGPMRRNKTARREMISSIVPVADGKWAGQAVYAAQDGRLDEARQHLEKIAVPRYRSQALASIAEHDPHPERALASWLRALAEARRAGRGMVEAVRPLGGILLDRAGRSEDAKELSDGLDVIEARWELESFCEQYEGLRRTLPSGTDRTRRMTALLHVPQRLAGAQRWTVEDIRQGWASNEEGKRLFLLALMQADPRLAVAQIIADAIRGSRSAFEQYHALVAASRAQLDGDARDVVLTAVEAEMRGVPRPDGVEPGLKPGTDRWRLAQALLGAKDL